MASSPLPQTPEQLEAVVHRAIAKDRADQARAQKEKTYDAALESIHARLDEQDTNFKEFRDEWRAAAGGYITKTMLKDGDFFLEVIPPTFVESVAGQAAERAARIVVEEAAKAAAVVKQEASKAAAEIAKNHKAFQDTVWGRVAIVIVALGVVAQYLQAFHLIPGTPR